MGKAIQHTLSGIDIYLFNMVCRLSGRQNRDQFFYLISRLGDGAFYLFLGIFVVLYGGETGIIFFFSGLAAFGIELVAYAILKQSVKRIRPFESLPGLSSLIRPPDKYSFPSGHSAAAFLFATHLSSFFPQLALPAFVFAGLVGFSRIYLRVHYPIDVLAGMLLGLTASHLVVWIL